MHPLFDRLRPFFHICFFVWCTQMQVNDVASLKLRSGEVEEMRAEIREQVRKGGEGRWGK